MTTTTLSGSTIEVKGATVTIDGTTFTIPAAPGETLPGTAVFGGGAIIVAETETAIPEGANTDPAMATYVTVRESIVLAVCPGAADPYVTWLRRVGVCDARGDKRVDERVLWGHYYDDLNEALQDYNERVARA
jgi:hypothetical protein